MGPKNNMFEVLPLELPVKLDLYKDGYPYGVISAHNDADLNCRIEMLTGVAWLDTSGLYQEMLDRGCDQISGTFRVCNSYEKWGGLQQEVASIRVIMQRL